MNKGRGRLKLTWKRGYGGGGGVTEVERKGMHEE